MRIHKTLFRTLIDLSAQVDAQRLLIFFLSQKLDLDQRDVEREYFRLVAEARERSLIQVEESNPGLAAELGAFDEEELPPPAQA